MKYFRKSLLSALAITAAMICSPVTMAQDEAEPEPSRILFTNVNVFDGVTDGLDMNTSVLIEGNLIKSVGASITLPEGTEVIDGGGRTLMPGLIGAHEHLNFMGAVTSFFDLEFANWEEVGAQAAANARNLLMDGFTTVRDLCGMGTGLKKVIDRGDVPGPRIYASAACISPPSGHGDWRTPRVRMKGGNDSTAEELGITILVSSPAEMTEAVRHNLSMGAAQIKVTAGGGVGSELGPIHIVAFTRKSSRLPSLLPSISIPMSWLISIMTVRSKWPLRLESNRLNTASCLLKRA